MLLWDTVRADHLTPYGYGKPTTPNLDQLSRRSVVYDQATSTSCWTLPAHASLFTGLYPSEHHAVGVGGKLEDGETTLAEALAANGYSTFVFSANPYVSSKHNLVQGFQVVRHPWDTEYKEDVLEARREALMRGEGIRMPFARFKEAGNVAQRSFLEWLEGRGDSDAPFFAFINYMEAHWPWFSSPSERSLFLEPSLVEESRRMERSYLRRHAYTVGAIEIGEDDLKIMRGLYDASIRRLDAYLGRLVGELRARGVLDQTLIVVLSDHGELLGEHHMLGHEYALYEPLIRIPLIISYPPLFPPGREDAAVQILDLYPTLLTVAGAGQAGGRSSGARNLLDRRETASPRTSLAEYLEPKPGHLRKVEEQYPVFKTASHWLERLRSVRWGKWKLILRNGRAAELYDISMDVSESHSLILERPELVDDLQERLRRLEQGFSMAPARPPGPDENSMDPEHLERLRSLGYADAPDRGSEEEHK